MKKNILLIILCFNGISAFTQNMSNKGREFWVGFGHHQYMEPSCDGSATGFNDMNMVIHLCTEQAAIVTISIDSSATASLTGFTRTYNIPANSVFITENLPKGSRSSASGGTDPNYDARLFDDRIPFGSGGEKLWRKRGIHIVSNVPIYAVAHIVGGVSAGTTSLFPVDTWAYSYTCINSEQRDASGTYSWMYVIAKDDNTVVEITPAAATISGKAAGVAFQVVMQKGQIYQMMAQADCPTGVGPELTGTTIKSLTGTDNELHPIAVFGGSSRTGGETLTCGTGSGRDNDIKQLLPENIWGNRYVTAPFSKATGSTLQPSQFQTSVFKVVVKDVSTIVKRNGTQLTGLISGKYYKFSSNTPDLITADKPVMVAQFMSGSGACNGGYGDPEMITLSPLEQAINKVRFMRTQKESILYNYVTVVVPTVAIPSLRIDSSAVFSHSCASL